MGLVSVAETSEAPFYSSFSSISLLCCQQLLWLVKQPTNNRNTTQKPQCMVTLLLF